MEKGTSAQQRSHEAWPQRHARFAQYVTGG